MSRLWWVLLAGAAVFVVGVLVVVGWVWRHPSAFDDADGWGVGHRDWPAGETAYVGMTYPAEGAAGTVTIHGADPHGLSDSTDARFEYFVCTADPAAGSAAVAISSDDHIGEECASLEPADDATMTLDADPWQQLVVAITPTRAGVVALHGIDLDYAYGWKRGTQRIGGDVRLQVRTHD